MNLTKEGAEKLYQKAKIATAKLSLQEKFARDQAFKQAPAYSNQEGWLWDVCWDAAREFYKHQPGLFKPTGDELSVDPNYPPLPALNLAEKGKHNE